MSRYHTLIFDLCDTIMPYRNDRMPEVKIRGRVVHTTSPLLYHCFQEYYTHIPYEQFHDDFVATTESIVLRRASGEEIPASVRFERFLDRLNIPLSDHRATIHRKLLQIHLDQVSDCLHCPDENRALLTTLKGAYRLGLITNFDDVETVYSVLDREGVRGLFDTVLISAEFGFRKPRKEIFLAACRNLRVDPPEPLFIGDSLTSDVAGAKGVGMEAAWMNTQGVPLPEDALKPDYILSTLTRLPSIL